MPLAAERAGVLEDHRAVAVVVLVERDPFMGLAQQLCQDALALLDGRAPRFLAVNFEQIEGAEHGYGIVPVSADQLEDGEATLVADDGRRSGRSAPGATSPPRRSAQSGWRNSCPCA